MRRLFSIFKLSLTCALILGIGVHQIQGRKFFLSRMLQGNPIFSPLVKKTELSHVDKIIPLIERARAGIIKKSSIEQPAQDWLADADVFLPVTQHFFFTLSFRYWPLLSSRSFFTVPIGRAPPFVLS